MPEKLTVPRCQKIRTIPSRKPKSPILLNYESFLACLGFLQILVPETDQKITGEAYSLPADKQENQVFGGDEEQHEKNKEVQIAEITPVGFIACHVPHGVNMDNEAYPGNHKHHHRAQAVESESYIGGKITGSDPAVKGVR